MTKRSRSRDLKTRTNAVAGSVSIGGKQGVLVDGEKGISINRLHGVLAGENLSLQLMKMGFQLRESSVFSLDGREPFDKERSSRWFITRRSYT